MAQAAPKPAAKPVTRTSPQPIKIDRSKVPELLAPNELKRADMELGSFVVWVPNDVTRDKVLRPAWWANHVATLRVGTPVVVMRRDMSMVLELRVRVSSPGMVKFIIMGEYDEAQADAEAGKAEMPELENPDAYDVKHTPQRGYVVLFKANGQQVSPADRKFGERDAILFANEHNKQAFNT